MTLPIGVQLYSLRDALSQQFEKTLEAVALAGYAGVEMAGFYDRAPADVARLLRDLNLTPAAMHTDVLSAEGLPRALEAAAALECRRLVCPWVRPETFGAPDSVKRFADQLNAANQTLQANGLTLFYHNHDFEFQTLDGRAAFFTFLERLEPTIQIELDMYWTVVGGADALATLKTLGGRLGLLHVKDGPVAPRAPMLAVGEGKIDYTTIIPALPESVSWLIVELDSCATDMLEAVQKSIRYLTAKGLGHGR